MVVGYFKYRGIVLVTPKSVPMFSFTTLLNLIVSLDTQLLAETYDGMTHPYKS